jgi:16S rRNA (cytosine967-C5)-methyltransferase
MPHQKLARRKPDTARTLAYATLRAVTAEDAYANLELGRRLSEAHLDARDAAFATELVAGTCRLTGTYDRIIAAASGRPTERLQPEVLDVLRLGAHQVLSMRVPSRAAVAATVDLAGAEVGERVVGLTNAVLRKVDARTLDEWVELLSRDEDALGVVALRTHHPRWIAEEYVRLLGDEAEEALAANNVSPVPTLVVRPGLATVTELDGEPTRWSPYGARRPGNPGDVPAVRGGRAGVQDEGSQLAALALARAAEGQTGRLWLDLCAGPGGKAALLAGLAIEHSNRLVAAELQPHRAQLVAQALRGYATSALAPEVLCADGNEPPWGPGSFGAVLADVPCSGLGALRRRPESRWRRRPADVTALVPLQKRLLESALQAAEPGGIVAYVTCSPHHAETAEVVDAVLAATQAHAERIRATGVLDMAASELGPYAQLWPHRHGTDAMFIALLRREE